MNGRGHTETGDAARKRVAIEMIAKHERALRRTARRYSICAADADDAYQRALEILLVKAPPGEARELVRWMQTVTKHEALAIRRSRERQLGPPAPLAAAPHEEAGDWLSLIPATGAGPAERAERREDIARSREALKTLKPAELKALTLLAEGYSYAEIGEMTGFSRTKVNRCLAEGRERFRAFLSRSESGARCLELRPVLSAFCDGEAEAEEAAALREHLRVCGHCRAAMRAYRAAPRAVAVLVPAPALTGSLLERAHDAFAGLQARLAAQGSALGKASATQVAAGGGGAGSAALAKAVAVCAGTVGGAALCVTAGVVPAPAGIAASHSVRPHIERIDELDAADTAPVAAAPVAEPSPQPEPPAPKTAEVQPAAATEPEPEPVETGAAEYAPPPPAPAPASGETTDAGSAAGEFGP